MCGRAHIKCAIAQKNWERWTIQQENNEEYRESAKLLMCPISFNIDFGR